MFSQLRLIGMCVVGFTVAALMLALHFERVHARKLSDRVVELTELRKSDRASYQSAQREAETRNKADVARIEARQEQVTQTVVSDYQRELADLRLRAQARAHSGSPSKAGISIVPKAAGGTDADGLLLSPDERLRAEEIELRLMHLQRWLTEQAGIAPNG